MRILCLHGKGTSGDIFRSQTAALRAKLDASYVFDFVDGPFASASAPGVDKLFDAGSGAYSWWPTESAQSIRSAHAWLDDYLAAHGPYDALMGFSQGCLLISSYLMHRARDLGSAPRSSSFGANSPPLPFCAAIFVCGGLSFTSLAALGVAIPPEVLALEKRSAEALHAKTRMFRELASQPDQIQRGVGLWDDTSGLVHELGAPLPSDEDVFGMDFTATGPFPADLFLTMPTVHVFGSRDPRYPAALQLAHASRVRKMYDHGGGHDIPRTTEVSERIAGLIAQLGRDIGL
ncbi:ef-hand calcium-binding protein domain protein [Sporothrix brasiliensis 5110]|uniref:Ef-hand calcium-binding protein domain protein n=1 Tax=Sporothrix brasiliensis 5110 TaxID=1398154 RepID=A0A0C2F0C9_9PEZI|nr:ef-hand calcium-binding protein domain protein [Sporothrix brasiliensis 5110]KIH92249.1 ef-hand calcium-binding protein domain protein [Sporothrix brasiliensis 5110]